MALTGYKAAQLVNDALETNGIDKRIPPQMMYNYMKKGFIKVTPEGFVDEESFAKWLHKYLEKNNVEVKKVEEEFSI